MNFLRCLSAMMVLAGLAFANQVTPPRKALPPDIFLVTIDTLRADHVHCYGYTGIQTPALDALAKDGARFTNAFTASPITNTSHTTILTGLLPMHHGVTDFGSPLLGSATLAETLKGKGYHTAAFIGAIILDSKTLAPGLDRGFDFYDNFPQNADPKSSRFGRLERRGMTVVEHAEHWMASHRAGPHFVWIHLYDPHDPYEPPPPYSETYKEHLYDGEIAYADAALARWMAFLKQQGLYSNSLLIVVGDHGEGLGEHGEDTHGLFLYDSTLHVPLIVKSPGQKNAGKVVQAQIRTVDVMPTALDFAGADSPQNLDGLSLKSLLTTEKFDDRVALGETDYPLRFNWAPLRSVRTPDAKFIEAPRAELYELQSDPGELKNVYDASNPSVQKARAMLADLKASHPAEAANSDSSKLPDPKDKVQEQNLLHTAMLAADDNQPAQARAALEQVLQLNAKQPTALFQLGELELKDEHYAKAADYLARARAVRPDDSAAALLHGQALDKMGDLTGARDALETSLTLAPSQFPARVLLGQVYLRLKDPKAAEDQFEAALLINPKSEEARIDLGRSLIAAQDFKEAVETLEPLSKLQPNNPAVLELLAQSYEGVGKRDEAQKARARAAALKDSVKPQK
jgi:arylsulfatase A-like enzyme/cytochrome c-type biogenesis protein CcmH/NrfG